MALAVATLTTVDQLRSLEEEWLGLLRRTKLDLPFLWPDWVITWWEQFRQQRSVIRDSLHVKTVRRESGELVAVVPLMLTERPGVGPARVRTIGFIGADKYVTEQRAPILDPAWESDVAGALATDLRGDRTWQWIAWEGLQPESELAKRLAREMNLRWGNSQPGNILHLAPSWEEFRRGLKHHIKDSIRHCYNSLQTEGLTASLDVAVTPDQVAPALEIFFDLHRAISQHADNVTRPDRFADPIARRFLLLACSRFASRNMARVFTLRIGGVPVVSRVGFLLPECLYLYYAGYDPAWRKYSVATTLTTEAIKYAINSGLRRVHLSMGADASKARWAPEMPVFYAAVCVRPGLYPRAALGLYSWARTRTGLLQGLKTSLGRRYE
jgi:CelD/BcsL family acetyltransferase involved in cellulose biosynthesis